MDKLIRNFTLSSCGLHIPQSTLIGRRFLTYPFSKLGFCLTPFALSSGAAVQLYDFCVGERSLSESVRLLAYIDKNQPTSRTRDVVDRTEIVLIELSTPIEPMIGDAIVNFNRVSDYILKPLRDWGADPKIVNNFSNAVFSVRDDVEERREILLANWPANAPDDALARFGVENLSGRRVGVDEMVRDLEYIRERIQAPMALKLFDFQYMPDGRAIEWPAGFKAQQMEVARRMNLPTLDVAPIVQRLGVKRLIADDLKHWRDDTALLQGQVIYDFMADVLDRPRLESHPESERLRRDLVATFPELSEMPSLVSLPGVVATTQISGAVRHGGPVAPARGGAGAARPPRPALPDELADRLNWELITLHRQRLNDLGVTESGLGPHYQGLMERETLVGLREERVLELVAWSLPAYDAYAVMRPGLGELVLLLAASGRRAIAFEPYATRRGAIEAGRAHLEAAGLLAPGLLTIVAGLTPCEPLEGRVLGVGLDVAHVHTEANAAPHVARLAGFEALLIDPRLFLRRRLERADQDMMVTQLEALGFIQRGDYPADFLSWFQKPDSGSRQRGDD